METVKKSIWVLKPLWEDDPEPVNVLVQVPRFGGAICFDSKGLLLTTVSAIIKELIPNDKSVFDSVLEEVRVRARCYDGTFREAVFLGEEQGLAVYKVIRENDDEVFDFVDLDECNNITKFTVSDKVFSFVHSVGNFSFRRGIPNTPLPRVLRDVVGVQEFPYLNASLPLLQFSNFGLYMSTGISGCAVFRKGETSHEFLGLIVFCLDQFSLVIPVSTIREVLPIIIEQGKQKEKDEGTVVEKGGVDDGKTVGGEDGKTVEGEDFKDGGGDNGNGGGEGREECRGLQGGLVQLFGLESLDAYAAAALKANLYAFPGIQATRFSASQIIMLLGHTIEHQKNVPPTVLVRLLREHRSEWADVSVDAHSAAALKANWYAFPGMRATRFSGSQIIMPLDHTIEHEEDNPTNRTVDLTLSLELGPPTNQGAFEATTSGSTRSVLAIAYQLPFHSNLQESVATMAHQYVRSVISTPSGLTPTVVPKLSLSSLEALTSLCWVCRSYCCHMGTGTELFQSLAIN